MPKIKGLSHVVLYVNDLEKMVAFYRDVLGLVKYREHPGRMVFMTPDPEIEDHQLALAKGRQGEAKISRAHCLARRDADRRQSVLRTIQDFGSADRPLREPRLRRDGQHRLMLFS